MNRASERQTALRGPRRAGGRGLGLRLKYLYVTRYFLLSIKLSEFPCVMFNLNLNVLYHA